MKRLRREAIDRAGLLNGWLRFFADTDSSVPMKQFADASWILFGAIFCIWIIADCLGDARKRKSKKDENL